MFVRQSCTTCVNSWRPCLRAQQRERLVIGDSKQCQVPLHRSSLASFLQKDAVSNNGSVWPLVLCAPWIFGRGMTRKKMFAPAVQACAAIIAQVESCGLCQTYKTRFNPISSIFSRLQQQMVRNQLQQVGVFFPLVFFFECWWFPCAHACVWAALSSSGLQFAYRLADHGQQQAWLHNLSVWFIRDLFKSPLA